MNSNKKKVTFETTINIKQIENIPYISGLYFCKFKSNSLKGQTEKFNIKNHSIVFNSTINTETTLLVSKSGILDHSLLFLSFRQDVYAGKKYDEIGSLSINLAEFAGQLTTSRRFLLQDSKLNAFCYLTVNMRLIKGDPIYTCPVSNIVPADDFVFNSSRIQQFDTSNIARRDSMPYLYQQEDINVDIVDKIFKQVESGKK